MDGWIDRQTEKQAVAIFCDVCVFRKAQAAVCISAPLAFPFLSLLHVPFAHGPAHYSLHVLFISRWIISSSSVHTEYELLNQVPQCLPGCPRPPLLIHSHILGLAVSDPAPFHRSLPHFYLAPDISAKSRSYLLQEQASYSFYGTTLCKVGRGGESRGL